MIFATAVLLLLSDPFAIASAREVPLMPADEAAITQAYESYSSAFESLEPGVMRQHCDLPLMFVSTRGVRVMSSSDEVDGFFRETMGNLRTRHYARSEVTDLRVKQMSRGIALVIVSRVRYDADGARLEWVGETFTLRKTARGWKVVVAAVHNPVTGM